MVLPVFTQFYVKFRKITELLVSVPALYIETWDIVFRIEKRTLIQ